ncbi:MAG: hypothetical protein NTY74_05325 [Ignavibacteriae bacterium]|nr:hypothetical protein [Ignavibacteriota bacterium]
MSLAKELSKSNISVNALAIVDAFGVVGNDLSVSENVEQVLNIRQKNGPLYFKGQKINAESSSTTVEEEIDESSNHFDIDENTIDRVINYFKEGMENDKKYFIHCTICFSNCLICFYSKCSSFAESL